MRPPPETAAIRAAAAAESVRARFGRRLFGMPGTHLPHPAAPGRSRFAAWQYWWLAHYIDALVDESEREQRCGRPDPAEDAVALAVRTLRTVRIRNGLRWRNRFIDDMAWLLLAVQRLRATGQPPSATTAAHRMLAAAEVELADGVRAGESAELGGGLYWNDRKDFKNVAATGPAALYWARTGDRQRAHRLVDWIHASLLDARTGLLADGIRRGPDGRWHLVPYHFTYNQGVVLGALVELADPASLARASDLVAAIAKHLAEPAEPHRLRTHGGHDGGLFTGIAARYLALAARSPGLPDSSRRVAATLVRDTATALWDGRTESSRGWVFPAAAQGQPTTSQAGARVELSTQLQAWLLMEAAATLDAPLDGHPAR